MIIRIYLIISPSPHINIQIYSKKMQKIKGSDITVSKEDQVQINTFSKLFSKHQDNQSVLRALNEKISSHKDTLDELIMN